MLPDFLKLKEKLGGKINYQTKLSSIYITENHQKPNLPSFSRRQTTTQPSLGCFFSNS